MNFYEQKVKLMSEQRHPLPFFNGSYWCDNSTLSTWAECGRKYEYKWQDNKEATFNKPALNYGKGMHLALGSLSLSCGSEYTKADLSKLFELLDVHFERNPQPADDHRTAGLAKETLRRYLKQYEVEPWVILSSNGFPIIERTLHCQISSYNGIPIMFYGVLDLAIKDLQGSTWVVDRKTTSMLGKTFDYDMAMTMQMPGYCWLFQKCFGVLPSGYIVDGIRSLAPSEKALADPKLLEKWWSEQFRRLPFFVDQEKINQWEETTLKRLKWIIAQAEDGHFPMNDKSCVNKYGCCEFYNICSLPFEQRKVALQSNNFMENDWLERTLKGKV